MKDEIKSSHKTLTSPAEEYQNKACVEPIPTNKSGNLAEKAEKQNINNDLKKQNAKANPNPIFKHSMHKNKPHNNSIRKTSEIRQFATKKHPNDVEMQQFEYEEQVESKAFMDKDAIEQNIKAFAIKEHTDDYSLQQYVYGEQVKSKAFMDEDTAERDIKAFAVKEHPDDYSLQQYVYEEQVKSKAFMDEEATEQDIKTFAVEEHPDDYSLQQYVYEERVEAR
ncbi:hypothetical protein HHE94_13265 [Pseudoalteromonas arctica]|uniref:Uncharacterized protein n=1 Tax=Pseudoalteromonas arctica TaxID=394751 RepID=A0AAP6Y5N5_9GAMM|nr:hypothetical protein [Pseudoalteromonas arctica]NMP03670.1 hypothetical protein [Pseudoalteromonas arctica]